MTHVASAAPLRADGTGAAGASTAARAHPILLVPGWSDRARVLQRLRSFLLRAGWTSVQTLEFADRYGSNLAHAAEIARAIEEMSAGRDSCVDIVAHSMGGLAVRKLLLEAGEHCPVRRVVFLGTPHQGTWVAWLAWGDGGREMRPGSHFLRELNSRPLPPQVRALALRAPFDLRVVPASSALLTEAANAHVPFATHRGLLRSAVAFGRVRDALLEPDA